MRLNHVRSLVVVGLLYLTFFFFLESTLQMQMEPAEALSFFETLPSSLFRSDPLLKTFKKFAVI